MRGFPPSWSLRALLCTTMLVACESLEPVNPDGAENGPPARLSITPQSVMLNAIGDTAHFDVYLDGNSRTALQASSVHWRTGDANVLAVTELGSFISTGVGVAVVVASCGDCGANGDTATVTVQQVVASVYLEPGGNTLVVGDSAWLDAVAADSNDVPVGGQSFEWTSSDPGVVSVGEDGRIVASSVGTAWVEATTGGISGRARIEVTERSVASVEVSPAEISLVAGEAAQLEAVAYDSAGGEIEGAAFGWSSSDPEVATVSAEGHVEAVADGGAEIIASARGRTGTASVSVSRRTAQSVALSPADTSLAVGDTARFVAIAYDGEGEPIEGLALEWTTSDAAVASVSDGRIEALAEGSATIAARVDGVEGQAALAVVPGEDEDGGDAADAFAAFPGAEGYGALALTGCDRRNPEVRFVTNRNDSGSGSFRSAVEGSDPDRLSIVVFRTGGTITVSQTVHVTAGCLYVAGQTAPGGGIQVRGPDHLSQNVTPLRVPRDGAASDLVFRYFRVRTGKSTADHNGPSNIGIQSGARIILDHISTAFSNDENISLFPVRASSGGTFLRDATVQWSLITTALRPHSVGLLVGGDPEDGPFPEDVSIHHNALIHNSHRLPLLRHVFCVEVINNVIYNWHGRVGNIEKGSCADYVGNYWRRGPWTIERSHVLQAIIDEDNGYLADPELFMSGNLGDPWRMDPDADQRSYIEYGRDRSGPLPASAFVSSPQAAPPVAVTHGSAADAYDGVLSVAGASARVDCQGDWQPARDALDARLVEQVRQRTGPSSDSENDHHDDHGGYPVLHEGTSCADADDDGMPDAFEERYGLDPNDPGDAASDPDGDGYTNIEEYVNGTRSR